MSQNLKDLKSSVAYFRLAFQALLDQSKGTVSLLRQIVKYRLTEDVNQSTRALGASMLVQRSLTARMQADNEGMLRLAEQGRQDDVRIKTLTLITILYLPATLIATIFSSNLVDTRAVDDNSPPARLAITPQFWIYVLVTAGFTILTLAVPTLVERGVLWRRGKGKREMPRQGRTENKETIGDKLDVERA
ncbi:hypothetical protein B0I37DRAFT_414742 [Chaetomium sp. MPI-CAGE-AT-0009]|nr:hypothetical protein B0I37DRAFT_414742 [Chaetomium sp. MPI-CAGE-AT-0009]